MTFWDHVGTLIHNEGEKTFLGQSAVNGFMGVWSHEQFGDLLANEVTTMLLWFLIACAIAARRRQVEENNQ